VKNEMHRLARELAKLTGESMTATVAEAVRQRLERIRGDCGDSLTCRLLAIGKDCATHLKEPFRSIDHADLLYGKNKVPR
jgi:antitoxin VapB